VLERLYRAYFIEQRSIFDHVSLIELGAEAGLPGDDVARVLRENAYAMAIEADLEEARAIPVNGVPFFVFDGGRYEVSGAQPSDVFAAALSRTAQSVMT
jgi:predicted DsbA family dithiol-disulfide isomerase